MRWSQRLREFLDDWQFMIARDGIPLAMASIGRDLLQLPYRRLQFVVLARPLNEPFPDLRPKVVLDIRPFQSTDIEIVRQMDRPSEAKMCARRLECGHKGLLAVYQGKPAGYAWGCAEVNPNIERVQIKLQPGDVLCTDVFTNPALRGLGIQTELALARFRLFRDLGFNNAICYIEQKNYPSRAVWERKLGARVIGSIDFQRIGAWYQIRYHGIPDSA